MYLQKSFLSFGDIGILMGFTQAPSCTSLRARLCRIFVRSLNVLNASSPFLSLFRSANNRRQNDLVPTASFLVLIRRMAVDSGPQAVRKTDNSDGDCKIVF